MELGGAEVAFATGTAMERNAAQPGWAQQEFVVKR